MDRTEAFKQGQRDAEQGWPANAEMWGFFEDLATAYLDGFRHPRG